MSGLRSSISTHIAREYYYGDKDNGHWGENLPLFIDRVGKYPERLNNLYLAFLFVLRGVSKIKELIPYINIDTGNAVEDRQVKDMLSLLVQSAGDSSHSDISSEIIVDTQQTSSPSRKFISSSSLRAEDQCRIAFDESGLFQVMLSGFWLLY